MQKVSWEKYLSKDNPWTLRLLGVEPFQQKRTPEKVVQNYDHEIYGKLLAQYQGDLEGFRESLKENLDHEFVFSLKSELFSGTLGLFRQVERSIIRQVFADYLHSSILCELGAGWGQNLLWLNEDSYGGEFSGNAVNIGRLLGFDLSNFDYYDHQSYEIIRPKTCIMTKHSVEQIPDATVIIDGLKKRRENINLVVHFEPICRDSRYDLIGLMRNRYSQINDYNTNLLACLEADKEIEILHFEEDVFGINPLNPTSVLVWKFI